MNQTAAFLRKGIAITTVGVIFSVGIYYSSINALAQTQEQAAASFNNPVVDAADRGDEQGVVTALREGNPVDSRGDFGVTPLMRAAFRGNTRIMQILIKLGADVDAVDYGGANALHLAARQGQVEAVNELLKNDAPLDFPDSQGWTPLMRAAISKKPEVVSILLKHGANPLKVNNAGESALVYAVKSDDPRVMQAFIDQGALTKLDLAQKKDLYSLAVRKGYTPMVTMLSSYAQPSAPVAAFPTIVNNTGPTVIAAPVVVKSYAVQPVPAVNAPVPLSLPAVPATLPPPAKVTIVTPPPTLPASAPPAAQVIAPIAPHVMQVTPAAPPPSPPPAPVTHAVVSSSSFLKPIPPHTTNMVPQPLPAVSQPPASLPAPVILPYRETHPTQAPVQKTPASVPVKHKRRHHHHTKKPASQQVSPKPEAKPEGQSEIIPLSPPPEKAPIHISALPPPPMPLKPKPVPHVMVAEAIRVPVSTEIVTQPARHFSSFEDANGKSTIPVTHVDGNKASEQQEPSNGAYWLQLGTFPSEEAANNEEAVLKKTYLEGLSRLVVTVSPPAENNSQQPHFRVRAGIFSTYDEASARCDLLMQQGANCIVVQD